MKFRVIGFTAIVAALAVTASAKGDFDQLIGKPFPAFAMKDAKGKAVTNGSFKGKVVLIDFWATWCGPCKLGMPTMQKLHKKFASQGLVVVGADVLEHGADAKTGGFKYAKSKNYSYLFTIGGDSLAPKLQLQGIPAVFLIDKQGVVRMAKVGFDPSGGEERELTAEIQKLLAQH